jgi:hypothetical protein
VTASRYADAKVRRWTAPDGAVVTYLAPRILPAGTSLPDAGSTVVAPGERWRGDLVAYRALGDPLVAYRLADANDAIDPLALFAEPGRVLRVPGVAL